MKIYCGRNRKGVWKASLDRSKLCFFDDVFESEIDVIHNNKVYMIKTYYGFEYDYSWGNGSSSIFDVVKYVFTVFHSVSAAKKHNMWKEREILAKKEPKNYHVTPFSIATDDGGVPFTYGDAMADNFNMQIITVKLI